MKAMVASPLVTTMMPNGPQNESLMCRRHGVQLKPTCSFLLAYTRLIQKLRRAAMGTVQSSQQSRKKSKSSGSARQAAY